MVVMMMMQRGPRRRWLERQPLNQQLGGTHPDHQDGLYRTTQALASQQAAHAERAERCELDGQPHRSGGSAELVRSALQLRRFRL
jgi:hypothetical protein